MELWPKTVYIGEGTLQRSIAIGFLISLPLGTVLACMGGIFIYGKAFSGYVWVLQGLLGILCFVFCKRGENTFPFVLWGPWVLWILLKCNWGDFISIQRTLMLILCPFMALVASRIVRQIRDLNWLLDCLGPVVIILWLFWIIYKLGILPSAIRFQVEGSAMTCCLGAVYYGGRASKLEKEGIVMWFLCVLLCAVSGMRTATFTCMLMLPLTPTIQTKTARLRSIVLLALVLLILTPLSIMSTKMGKDSGSLKDVLKKKQELNTSGRFYAWGLYLEEAWKNPFAGAGGNASGDFGKYNIMDESQWLHPHNEYIRVFFDYGIIGLILLGIPVCITFGQAWYCLRTLSMPVLLKAWLMICGGFIALCLLSITDNVLLYVQFFGCYLFAVIGAAYGLTCAPETKFCHEYLYNPQRIRQI